MASRGKLVVAGWVLPPGGGGGYLCYFSSPEAHCILKVSRSGVEAGFRLT